MLQDFEWIWENEEVKVKFFAFMPVRLKTFVLNTGKNESIMENHY